MSSSQPLQGKVCLVTGATRGLGKGIALQLGEAGATVYITGRSLKPPENSPIGGCLEDTAKEIEQRGGKCIPVQCDHSQDGDVEKLFERIKSDQQGQLDVLVNNAYSGVQTIQKAMNKPFYELPPTFWDEINSVGLRNNYLCAVYAARMMAERKSGLIVNISSAGGLKYLFNPAYGIGKEACDRMAVDCALELKKDNVAFVSLWPGLVKTEFVVHHLDKGTLEVPKDLESLSIQEHFASAETTEFPGKCIVHLAKDRHLMKKTGKILLTAELAKEYGFRDINGRHPNSMRQLNGIMTYYGRTTLGGILPNFLKLPRWMIHLAGNKF